MKKILEKQLHVGIHTISVNSSKKIDNGVKGISHLKTLIKEKTGEIRHITKINPNDFYEGELDNYNTYRKVIENIVNEFELSDCLLSRADIRIDSYDDDYDELLKLNKLIVLLIAYSYNIKNQYQSFNPLTLDNLTVRVQNEYYEAENYNRAIKSENIGLAKNRLELRSKALLKTGKDIPMIMSDWIVRLENLPSCYEKLQDLCNYYLYEKWIKEKDVKVKSLSEFIRKYQDNIFTVRQLINFLGRIGVENPTRTAYNFNSKSKIEYYSKTDVQRYIKNLTKSLNNFIA